MMTVVNGFFCLELEVIGVAYVCFFSIYGQSYGSVLSWERKAKWMGYLFRTRRQKRNVVRPSFQCFFI